MAGSKPKDKPTKAKVKKKTNKQPASSYLRRKEDTLRQLDQAFSHQKKKKKKGNQGK